MHVISEGENARGVARVPFAVEVERLGSHVFSDSVLTCLGIAAQMLRVWFSQTTFPGREEQSFVVAKAAVWDMTRTLSVLSALREV